MTVRELIKHLEHLDGDDRVVVKVHTHTPTVGPQPCTNIEEVHSGFDWDSGRVMLVTDEPVYVRLDKFEAAAKFATSVRNTMFFWSNSESPRTRNATAIKSIVRALNKWLPDRHERKE